MKLKKSVFDSYDSDNDNKLQPIPTLASKQTQLQVTEEVYDYDSFIQPTHPSKSTIIKQQQLSVKDTQPKYIHNIIATAHKRKLDHQLQSQQKRQKEHLEDGMLYQDKESFTSNSYKQQKQLENYFSKLGGDNDKRSEALAPNQGGKYVGFGSGGNNGENQSQREEDDPLASGLAALSKGWGFFTQAAMIGLTEGAKLAKTGVELISEKVIKPAQEVIDNDPNMSQFVNTIGTTVSSGFNVLMKESGSLLDRGAVFVNETTGSQFETNSGEYDQVRGNSPTKSEEWGDWDGVSPVVLDAKDPGDVPGDFGEKKKEKNTNGSTSGSRKEAENGDGWSNDF